MRDFNLDKYHELCKTLLDCGYSFLTICEYLKQGNCDKETKNQIALLRHDVDRKPDNALQMARLEHEMDFCSTYYFRYPYTFKPDIIRKIRDFGHEIGYHYEVLAKAKGDPEIAIRFFEQELKAMRHICEIKTVCMHGSPLSPYDNRDLWINYDFRVFGIIGEAYLSFRDTILYYFTDTGRTWNRKHSLRDAIPGIKAALPQLETTDDLINWIRSSEEKRLYLTVHPERWPLSTWGRAQSFSTDIAVNFGKKVLTNVRK